MKVPIWLFDLFPFLFPKTKRVVRIEIQNILEKRWKIVSKKIFGENMPLPKLSVSESLEYFHQTGLVNISYSSVTMEESELIETIDHELAHYAQFIKNSKAYKSSFFEIFGGLYWFLKGKMNTSLAQKAFREGFATYIAFLTSGEMCITQKEIDVIQKRKLLRAVFVDNRKLPYILGYLAYSALAKNQSEKHAILCGLTSDSSDWLSKSRIAITKLGEKYPI